MRGAAKHLLSVVEHILDMAKADTGNLRLATQHAVVADVIDAAVALVHPQAVRKNVAIDVLADEHLEFLGDEDRARQIVVNLLANAVKFAPPDTRLSVTSGHGRSGMQARRANDAAVIWITISDEGPGIRLEDQERIFEPFKQASGAHSRSPGGTGLGLALSRRLARLMNGDLTVRSEPGHGAAFTVWLPSGMSSDRQ